MSYLCMYQDRITVNTSFHTPLLLFLLVLVLLLLPRRLPLLLLLLLWLLLLLLLLRLLRIYIGVKREISCAYLPLQPSRETRDMRLVTSVILS